jgi:hypothetical protein
MADLILTREHLGKIVRFDTPAVLYVHEKEFKEGDILVLFNNTLQATTLKSDVALSYRSTFLTPRRFFEVPAKALVNLIWVADDTVVLTVGL